MIPTMSSDSDRQRELKLKALDGYRSEIDKFDKDIIEALGERMKVVDKIAGLKKGEGEFEIEDKEREKEVCENWHRLAGYKNLSGEFVGKILDIVFSYSKSRQ